MSGLKLDVHQVFQVLGVLFVLLSAIKSLRARRVVLQARIWLLTGLIFLLVAWLA